MYPPKFDYVAARSLDEVLELLGRHGDEAKVLAGGQSLIPLLKLRFASPKVLVDINGVGGLDRVEERDGQLRVGALARHNALVDSSLLQRRYPTMAAAAPQIADPLVRNLGTIGGSLAHADPQGDWGSVMLAMNAQVVARSQEGERLIPIDDFFRSVFWTTLEPTELLTEIRIPQPRGRFGGTYLKLERKVGDFASVGVAVNLELSNGQIAHAGIGLTAVGNRNIKAKQAEAALQGVQPSPELFAQAAQLAADAAEPNSDLRGSADYKRNVVRVYVERGLTSALEMARA